MEPIRLSSKSGSKILSVFFEILRLTENHIIPLLNHFEIKFNLLRLLITHQRCNQVSSFTDKNDSGIAFYSQELGELMR